MGSKRPLTPFARTCAKYLFPCVNREAVCLGSNSKWRDNMMIKNSRQLFETDGSLLGSSLLRSTASLSILMINY